MKKLQRKTHFLMQPKVLLAILVMSLVVLQMSDIASAQVTVNEDLRPDFAVNFGSPEAGSGAGAATSAGNKILQLLAGSLIFVAGPIAVLMIAISGLRYVTSAGDQSAMEGAKKTLTWSLIGLGVIIVSWTVITNIARILSGL